jgi:nucleoside-diphosphate-sugar epimerase
MGFVPRPPGGASSIIHVHDLARLLVELAGRPNLKKIYEPDDGREGGWSHKELANAIGRAMGKRLLFAPHLPRSLLNLAASADKLVRGDKAKLTADRVGYMTHPNWVSRFEKAVPNDMWQPQISGEEGLKATADWYRAEGWL